MRKQPMTLIEEGLRLQGSLAADLAQAASGGSVHGARRSIKRLRSLVRLVRDAVGEDAYRQANAELKTAADALASRRRAEALAIAADRLKVSARTAEKLKEMAQRRHAQDPTGTGSLELARQAIARLGGVLESWRMPHGSVVLLEAAFGKTYRKAREQLADAVESGKAEDLHEARKQVIHHLHHLELLHDQMPAKQVNRIARLEKLREVLGDINDLDELAHLAGGDGKPLKDDLRKALARRHEELIAEAKAAWKPLFGVKTDAYVKRIGAMWQEGKG